MRKFLSEFIDHHLGMTQLILLLIILSVAGYNSVIEDTKIDNYKSVLLQLMTLLALQLIALYSYIDKNNSKKAIQSSAEEGLKKILSEGENTKYFLNHKAAEPHISDLARNEKSLISIVAGSLNGTSMVALKGAQSNSNRGLCIKIMVASPDKMRERTEWEDKAIDNNYYDMLDAANSWLTTDNKQQVNIKVYKGAPTCSAIFFQSQKVIYLNPYPLSGAASKSLSISYKVPREDDDVYDEFVDRHFSTIWNNKRKTTSLENIMKLNEEAVIEVVSNEILKGINNKKDGHQIPPQFIYVIAINGAPNTGKSTFSKKIRENLGKRINNPVKSMILETDNWIEISRKERLDKDLSGFHSQCYDMGSLSDLLSSLYNEQENGKIFIPNYCHKKGEKVYKKEAIDIEKVVIIEGLMSTCHEISSFIDMRITLTNETEYSPDSLQEQKRDDRKRPEDTRKKDFEIHERHWSKFKEKYLKDPDIKLIVQEERYFQSDLRLLRFDDLAMKDQCVKLVDEKLRS